MAHLRRPTETGGYVFAPMHALAGDVTRVLSLFDPVWEVLYPREQARIIHLLIERVEYDGANGTLAINFRPSGMKTLAQEAVS